MNMSDTLVGLEPMDDDDSIAFSFSGEMISGTDYVVTQHRYYWFGDNIVIAIGEVNFPNSWNDAAFDEACAKLEAAFPKLPE